MVEATGLGGRVFRATCQIKVDIDRAAEADIPVLDLLPIFRQACREKRGGPCQREDRYLFADVRMHPSAYGHALTIMLAKNN
jgi:hypothetical protein